ncbi:hypothetical protein Plhal304r1_c029g0095561 [Plasmopara halstedii]
MLLLINGDDDFSYVSYDKNEPTNGINSSNILVKQQLLPVGDVATINYFQVLQSRVSFGVEIVVTKKGYGSCYQLIPVDMKHSLENKMSAGSIFFVEMHTQRSTKSSQACQNFEVLKINVERRVHCPAQYFP